MPLKTSKAVLLLFLIFFSILAKGQHSKFIVVEAGAASLDCTSNNKDYLRADIPDYTGTVDGYGTAGDSKAAAYKWFVGVKGEVRSLNNKFGLLTGLRFSTSYTSLEEHFDPGYFYFLHQQTGTTTEYLRVHEIMQTSNYLGLPVEMRYMPFGKKKFNMYIMAGGEINFRLSTKNKTTFEDPSMDIYQRDVSNKVGMPNTTYTAFYWGIGFTVGKAGKPKLNFGVNAPLAVTAGLSSLVTPTIGGGFHIEIQLPIKQKK